MKDLGESEKKTTLFVKTYLRTWIIVFASHNGGETAANKFAEDEHIFFREDVFYIMEIIARPIDGGLSSDFSAVEAKKEKSCFHPLGCRMGSRDVNTERWADSANQQQKQAALMQELGANWLV